MSMLKSYFGLGGAAAPAPVEDGKSAVRALPASWYTSAEMYELERRAIFSRKWLLTTHKARVPKAGDWVRYDVAGYQFIIVQDRSGKINAFHNICRHRAFPIVTAAEGNSSIFSCKYHGWSYGLSGNLAKAPGYQDLEGFDKSKNNLLPLHVHVDTNGYIWVNMDAGEEPEIPWSKDFAGVDEQPRFEHYNFEDYVFDHTWEMEGEYNWKILADNYNECYHCKTTHPDIPKIADLNSYYVKTKDMHIQHFGNPTSDQIDNGFRVASTYFWPNASLNVSPHFFFIQRFVPSGPTKSTMKYEVYRNKNSSDADFKVIDDMYKRIMSEDKVLCSNAQKNLSAGVFVNGEMHPKMEQGPLYFQKTVREVVREHFEKEQAAGAEIWPAQMRVPKTATASQSDTNFCSAVDCCRNNTGGGSMDAKKDMLLATEITA
ncbi:probable Rieske 2Fe-2S family protein [Cephalotrichum gorgonifer]|uniref:Choline monooxygenase, chloroplastic n=1 Tax=Cephalotrichum gorgonifer TaxID=2041049 RepID=A0AAE8MVQ8_9PEZI|nr:probable Rieske 2Fe-2S family protein [Cephalotrichum gorgonifer]